MRKWVLVFLVVLGIGTWWASDKYSQIYGENVEISSEEVELLIHRGDSYEQVEGKLLSLNVLRDADSFIWVAEKKNYPALVKPGRYLIKQDMSNNDLVDMLRSGAQAPIMMSFNNVRNLPQLAGKLAQKLEPDSMAFLRALSNPETISKYGFKKETFISMFIPNSYELYWTTEPDAFIDRMAQEFKSFWTEGRRAKMRQLGLTQSEVVTLASIVQAEQSLRPEEWKTIAGLYLNRVRRGIKLQSDPTVIYAVGDFTIRRVLNKHLKVDSPYNTYKQEGLPPGPIRMPDIGAVDAVLNAEKHDYIFMCAKADLSGFHHFSKTNREHSRYARQYRRAMDSNKIYK